MHGREHLVGITAHKNGTHAGDPPLCGRAYGDAEPYFEKLDAKADTDAVKLAVDLIEQQSGKFEPQKMPNEYARAVHELVQAKIEQRAPEVEIETAKGETPEGHQHHGRAEKEHAGERPGEGQRCGAEANGKGSAQAGSAANRDESAIGIEAEPALKVAKQGSRLAFHGFWTEVG